MQKFWLYVSLLLTIVSCKTETASNDPNVLQVDFNKEITIKYSELFDAFEIVQLKPFTPIGSLDKLIYTDGHIIVIDQTINKMIHIFSKSGAFIAEINNKGNGPGEFKNQRGVRLSKNKEDIYFYCPINKKILIYGLDGVFKNEFYQKDFLSVGDMFVVDDGIMLVDFVQDDNDKKIIFLEENFVNYQYLKFSNDGIPEADYERGKSEFFFAGADGFYYKERMENSFTYFKKDRSNHQIKIDLGDKSLVLKSNMSYTFQELNQEMETQDAYILADALVDLGEYLLMDLRQADKTQMIISDKKTQNTVLVRTLENDMDGIFRETVFPIFDSPGYFVYPINYYFLKSIIDMDSLPDEKYKSEINKIGDADAEDIILLVYKLKSDINIKF